MNYYIKNASGEFLRGFRKYRRKRGASPWNTFELALIFSSLEDAKLALKKVKDKKIFHPYVVDSGKLNLHTSYLIQSYYPDNPDKVVVVKRLVDIGATNLETAYSEYEASLHNAIVDTQLKLATLEKELPKRLEAAKVAMMLEKLS